MSPDFVSVLGALGSLVGGLSALALVVLAWKGLNQWRAELKGRSKFELTQRIALAAFRFQRAFYDARISSGSPVEWSESQKDNNALPFQTSIVDEQQAKMKRLGPLQEILVELREVGWEAELILGKEMSGLLEPLEAAVGDFAIATRIYFNARLDRAKGGQDSQNLGDDWFFSQSEKLYGTPDDKIFRSVGAAVQKLVGEFKEYVK